MNPIIIKKKKTNNNYNNRIALFCFVEMGLGGLPKKKPIIFIR